MSTTPTIRIIPRPVIILSVAVVGVQLLGMLAANPARASCIGRECFYRHYYPHHSYPQYWWYHRRGVRSSTSGGQQSAKHGPYYQHTPAPIPTTQGNPSVIRMTPPAATLGGLRPAEIRPASTTMPATASPPASSTPSAQGSAPILIAVPACVTPQGSCPMPQRALGTACQCMDQQGHVYDGIVK